MLFQLIKKNMIVLIRNRSNLIQLLVMPVVLIAILGFALSGMMGGDSAVLKAKVYMVEHGSEDAELQEFLDEVERSNVLPEEAKAQISEAAKGISPVALLKEQVLTSEELSGTIEFKVASPDDLNDLKKDEKSTAIIEVPKGFTYDFLQNIFFQKGEAPALKLMQNESEPLSNNMLSGILEDVQEQYAFSNFLQKEQLSMKIDEPPAVRIAEETVNESPAISSAAYYTIGMGVMFIYFIVSNLSAYAYQEKSFHMYNRILLSNVTSWCYLGSYFISGALLAFIQLCILFGSSVLLYDVRIPSIPLFFLITICASLGIGGFTAFITALSLKWNSEKISDSFSSIITFFCFFGGSYVPISTFPDWFQTVGSFTLNGAGLKAYMNMMQQYEMDVFSNQLWTMLAYGVLLFILAVGIFPRRGEA